MEDPKPPPAESQFLIDLNEWWPIEDLEHDAAITSFEHDTFQLNSSFDPPSSGPHLDFQPAEFNYNLGPETSALNDSFFVPSQSAQSNSQEELPTSWSMPSIHNEQWIRNTSRVYSDGGLQINSSQESLALQTSLALPGDMKDPSHHYLSDELINDGDVGWDRQTQSHNIHHTVDPRSRSSLPRRRSRYFLQKSGPRVTPIFTPDPPSALDPMQRWQESPPEDEPVSMSAIIKALNPPPTEDPHLKCHGIQNRPRARGHDSFRGYRRPASTASSQSSASVSSRQSAASTRSATSAVADPLAAQTQRSHRRFRKNQPDKSRRTTADKGRIFCCTFCCDRFKNKYDWVRHEKSLHLNLESWICAPHGGSVVSPLTGRQHCAYCNALDPTSQHLDEHNHQACSAGKRSFRRKDHLAQHLRLTHHLDAMPLTDDWKANISAVVSRCGFCDQHLNTWDERIDHLAGHFRKGSTMSDWQGDHGFSPEITAQITNALPPYLIGPESRSVVPFSATNPHVKDHLAQISTRAEWNIDANNREEEEALVSSLAQLQARNTPLSTFTEILTQHLSRYAREQMKQGIFPTDENFQRESRRVLYDCEDSWNQTIADNPEWLSAFRGQYCRAAEQSGIE